MGTTNKNSKVYFKSLDGTIKVYADIDPHPWPEFRKQKLGSIKTTVATGDGTGNLYPGTTIVTDMGEDITHATLDMTFEQVNQSTFNTLDQLRDLAQPILVSPDDGATQEYKVAFKPNADIGLHRLKGLATVYTGTLQFQVLSQTIGAGGHFDPPGIAEPS